MSQNRNVVIVASSRIPFTKSFSHYAKSSNQEMLTVALKGLVQQMNLKGKKIDEVAMGAVIKHSYDWNMARECVLGSGLAADTPAYDLQRACGTSLEAVVQIANKITLGQIECGIAGGSDSNSDAPLEFQRSFAQKMIRLTRSKSLGDKVSTALNFRPKDLAPRVPAVTEPRTGKSMGQHCELMAQEWDVTREEQDALTLVSHQNAEKAYSEGFYDDLVVEFNGLKKDSIVRGNTSLEQLAKLRPVFDRSEKGTLTAGNSTALTDGASTVLLASEEYAKKQGWPILARFVDAQSSAVNYIEGEGLLMAPTVAVADLLKRNNLTFNDFSTFEIHEAFAAQVLCTLKAWEDEKYCKERLGWDKPLGSIDRSKMNLKGGSVALGHPFAATGTRITGALAKTLSQTGGRGLISVCTAGGMGVAAILESASN